MRGSKESARIDPDATVQVRKRSSIEAHAFDLGGADSTLETRWYAASARRKRLFWLVSAAVALSAAILVVAFARRAVAASADAQPVLSSVTVVGTKLPSNATAPVANSVQSASNGSIAPATSNAIPVLDVTSLPPLTTGRVVLTAGARVRRLVVDGAVVSGSPAIVRCGRRAIKIGNRKARTVDVPCGADLTLR